MFLKKMFKQQLDKTMEACIDDMVVKSKKAKNHIQDLEEAFDILDELSMKLTPFKWHFGVKVGKFLGYMVIKRGFEASPEWIKTILNLQFPSSTEDI